MNRFSKRQGFWAWCLMALVVCTAGARWSQDPFTASVVAFPGLKLRAAPRSLAVYPKQELPLNFSHKVHLAKGMSCKSCHAQSASSERASDDLLPVGQTCDTCHGAQHPPPLPSKTNPKPKRACAKCHAVKRGLVAKSVSMPAARLRFSHKAHKDAPCSRCHGDLRQVDLATRDHLPTESNCLGCHDGKAQSNACQLCHPQDGSGRLRTRPDRQEGLRALVPQGDRRGALTHDLRFVYDHAAIALAQRDQCMSCHSESFCSDCHGNGTRPLQIHPPGYLGTHGIEASTRGDACMSCHQRSTDCRACHLRFGISDDVTLGRRAGTGAATSSLAFHPPGYATPSGEQAHASDARKNINACASCHSEDTCLSCHATSGVAKPGLSANPHGPNFVASGRCRALASNNRRVCLKCHTPGDQALQCQGRPKHWMR